MSLPGTHRRSVHGSLPSCSQLLSYRVCTLKGRCLYPSTAPIHGASLALEKVRARRTYSLHPCIHYSGYATISSCEAANGSSKRLCRRHTTLIHTRDVRTYMHQPAGGDKGRRQPRHRHQVEQRLQQQRQGNGQQGHPRPLPWRLKASAASAALNPYNPIQTACPRRPAAPRRRRASSRSPPRWRRRGWRSTCR